VSRYQENDGRFPDDASVLVRYPLDDKEDRETWPWLPGSILGQGASDEWHVVVDGSDDLAEPDPEHPSEFLYPACFRDASELRLITESEFRP
jgi:hypothetical protein